MLEVNVIIDNMSIKKRFFFLLFAIFLVILGAKQKAGEIEFNPSHSQVFTEGMTLIVMGEVDDITRAKKAF